MVIGSNIIKKLFLFFGLSAFYFIFKSLYRLYFYPYLQFLIPSWPLWHMDISSIIILFVEGCIYRKLRNYTRNTINKNLLPWNITWSILKYLHFRKLYIKDLFYKIYTSFAKTYGKNQISYQFSQRLLKLIRV